MSQATIGLPQRSAIQPEHTWDASSIFPDDTAWESELATLAGRVSGSCRPDATTLCLLNGRFAVRVNWSNPGNGTSGQGGASALSNLVGNALKYGRSGEGDRITVRTERTYGTEVLYRVTVAVDWTGASPNGHVHFMTLMGRRR